MPMYEVYSPEYEYVEPVLDYGEGPTMTKHAVCIVWAENKREARIKAVRQWRSEGMRYHELDENPYKGVKAYTAEELQQQLRRSNHIVEEVFA
jgi:hypothetical protein